MGLTVNHGLATQDRYLHELNVYFHHSGSSHLPTLLCRRQASQGRGSQQLRGGRCDADGAAGRETASRGAM